MASHHSQIDSKETSRDPMFTAGLATLLWTLMVIALLLVCWYPDQRMLSATAADWAQRYDTFHASGPKALFPSMQTSHDLMIKRHKEAMSLIGFMDSFAGSHDLELKVENPGIWEPLLVPVQKEGHVYVKPVQWPLAWPEPGTTPPRNLLLRQGPEVQFLDLNWLGPEDVFVADLAWTAKYPMRRYALLAGVILLGALALVRWKKGPQPPVLSPVHTTSGLMVKVSLICTLVGLAMAFTPHIYGVWGDAFELGYGVFLVGIILAGSGIVSGLISYHLYSKLRSLLAGKDRLALWTYDQPQWAEAVQEISREQGKKNRRSLLYTGLVFLAAIVFFSVPMGGLLSKILGAAFGGMLILALGLQVLTRRKLLRGVPEAHIGRYGLYVGGQTHVWNVFPVRLAGVELTGKAWPCLSFTYTQPGHRGMTTKVKVTVPVPKGKEQDAEYVISQLPAGTT